MEKPLFLKNYILLYKILRENYTEKESEKNAFILFMFIYRRPYYIWKA